jgi:hypothetical protein
MDESHAYLPALVPAGSSTSTMLVNFLDINRLPASFIDVPLIKIRVKQLSQDGKVTLFSASMEKHARDWVSGLQSNLAQQAAAASRSGQAVTFPRCPSNRRPAASCQLFDKTLPCR